MVEPSAELGTPDSVAGTEDQHHVSVRAECLRFALEAEFETFGSGAARPAPNVRPCLRGPRPSASLGYQESRRKQIDRAEAILAASHDERLERWRGGVRESAEARARGDRTFRVARRRVPGRYGDALRS